MQDKIGGAWQFLGVLLDSCVRFLFLLYKAASAEAAAMSTAALHQPPSSSSYHRHRRLRRSAWPVLLAASLLAAAAAVVVVAQRHRLQRPNKKTAMTAATSTSAWSGVVGTPAATTATTAATASPALYYREQRVNHLADASEDNRTWSHRYYASDRYFAGPGRPIFLVLGGEGAMEPEHGLLYPFVTDHLAKTLGGAHVVQPEHRYYGASQPTTPATDENSDDGDDLLVLFTYEQALHDAIRLVQKIQQELGCSSNSSSLDYCPVVAVGGSYPGFLSAMARVLFPHVVDMAYAASAPIRLYAQQVDSTAYYAHITAVAEAARPGCARAVRDTLLEVQHLYAANPMLPKEAIGACSGSIPEYCATDVPTFLQETFMVVAYTFANANMAYYPPSNDTALYRACEIFANVNASPIDRLRKFLVSSLATAAATTTTRSTADATGSSDDGDDRDDHLCFDMSAQLPSGARATLSAGDWSGVGTGDNGRSWDFQTCTYCVEAIGFSAESAASSSSALSNATANDPSSGERGENTRSTPPPPTMMFPPRPWSLEWLTEHCRRRFNVTPDPDSLNRRWHIDTIFGADQKTSDNTNESTAVKRPTRILFTNGMNDGWSVTGILDTGINNTEDLPVLNFPNGAHHSDLSALGPTDLDTDDIKRGYVRIERILSDWLLALPGGRQSHAANSSNNNLTPPQPDAVRAEQ
jgi:Serine carboxypeptidase S28